MNLNRQAAIKCLWETVVSNTSIPKNTEFRNIRGYDSTKLTFISDGEYILIKKTMHSKDVYSVFKPIGMNQRFVEGLIKKLKEHYEKVI